MRYEPTHQGLRHYLLSDHELGRALEFTAQDIAAAARVIAPKDSGTYAAEIGTEPGPVVKIARNFRQSVNVVANAPYSASIEFGYVRKTKNGPVNVPGQHVLTRAAEAAGGV